MQLCENDSLGLMSKQQHSRLIQIATSCMTGLVLGVTILRIGYISLSTIAEQLLCPPEAIDPGPTITFDVPLGWKKSGDFPSRSDFKKGKVYLTIAALDELAYECLMNSFEFRLAQVEIPGTGQPRLESSCGRIDVVFGECHGRKYFYRMTAPAHWKQIDYMLCVPGGYVSVWLGTKTGADFDEAPVEAKLHTLRLS
jgi:hypothetical protein